MLNRMWSEAELAVYMLQITSSSKRANSCLLFAPFGDGIAPIRHTPELRMNPNRPPFALQKAVNCTLKSRKLQGETRLFTTRLIIRQLQRRQKPQFKGTQKGVATLVRAATPCNERVRLMLCYFFLSMTSITPFLAASPYLSVVCFASLYTFICSILFGVRFEMSSTCLPSTM